MCKEEAVASLYVISLNTVWRSKCESILDSRLDLCNNKPGYRVHDNMISSFYMSWYADLPCYNISRGAYYPLVTCLLFLAICTKCWNFCLKMYRRMEWALQLCSLFPLVTSACSWTNHDRYHCLLQFKKKIAHIYFLIPISDTLAAHTAAERFECYSCPFWLYACFEWQVSLSTSIQKENRTYILSDTYFWHSCCSHCCWTFWMLLMSVLIVRMLWGEIKLKHDIAN